ncbi:MAG: Gfo/Idh/MocA family oxidoreductase [Ferrovibrio sp.]|uniref:Gfo/Idh/MocA family protein n=1 Tax=Ferrovibrio sp. TaxID=1917215 RepID=UPI00260AD956|nr:Gfo/Idh/MocA family oxidoreductase [Ferrovibrio sp.]MCW0234935.1 Gfo/Idh/MocA family oxidoreductase [Ferrovibrio sp.]
MMRVGIVGLGVGEAHLRSYESLPDCEVSVICDIDPDRLQLIGNRYGVARRTTDWRHVTEATDIDIVSICSYDDAHSEQCISAFQNGKHVFVEKPVALFRRDAEAILRAQQDAKRTLSSNLILRESPRFKELRRQVQAGEYGEIICIEGDYLHDILWKIIRGWRGQMPYYSTIYGGGIHLIDLMRWIVGAEVAEVATFGNKILTRDTSYRFDDTFLTMLKFQNQTLGKCLTTLGPARPKFHALNVYGTKRSFENDTPDAKVFSGDQPENESKVVTPYPGMEKGDLIPEFVEAISNHRQPNVNHIDVFRVMDVCFAAMEAAEQRRTISISYLI